MRDLFRYSTSQYDSSPHFQLEKDFEVGLASTRTVKQIYASQTKVKPLVDANFWNIFYDRNKLVVVAFWADSCRACAESASVMTSMANRFFKGPAGPVKFYQVQWDPKVNPRVHQSFGFKSVPVVFFYYTSTGRPPTKAAPLLEASLGYDERHEASRFVQRIEAILRDRTTVSVSKRRGWKHSRTLITKSDFTGIDQILIEPSPFQQYFVNLYQANPPIRFSKRAQVHTKSTFNLVYQSIYGQLPASDVAGVLDKRNQRPHMLVDNFLQTNLGSAIHEAVHLYCCPVIGANTSFHTVYGFGLTEGFTQYITEEILKSQGLAIVQPSPYAAELDLAKSLIKAVGLRAVADAYFLCARVRRIQNYLELLQLNREAASQRALGSERGVKQSYEKMKRFLDAIRPRP